MRLFLAVFVSGVLPAAALAQPAPELSGKWSGYWVSDANGHTGPLHARFTPQGDDAYRVTYRGRFAKVIPFRYSTTMDVVGRGDGVVLLSAEKPLGPFGTFRTTAVVTGTTFDATFNSRRDSGRFVLRR
ncbi:hypothetical protein GobsT_22770 [Gemmata obscuriglobus]|uniref:Lipocalin-like domain-containing protein n=1 Tax=Gemmata obscuriglobus TaxID=114 RepID=A0A2Z3H4Z7_9BACT|nr:hypothetical protein [Gemmata obscuriglobus]AWM39402.1 hypothetical protein C1280_22050 [Gemmata obscuriglobus]QEG27521.1 hypothetical protein GobsT_22770 [Gemmata obscuriglobus]VTS04561.1 Uncharacterized protein OS=Pirellula staleyi (strain ATCC 27377 / DSM 6068 / ICPB 4128) GN=Psta_4000 PE=4 SV=1 [Gemmata obscuriglobus UQM 2246]